MLLVDLQSQARSNCLPTISVGTFQTCFFSGKGPLHQHHFGEPPVVKTLG